MNKAQFRKLDRNQMILAFNQLKDDYRKLNKYNEMIETQMRFLKRGNKRYVDLLDITNGRIEIFKKQLADLREQKTDYSQVNILEMQLVEKQKIIDNAIKYLRSNEWSKDYKLSFCRTHLLSILEEEK